MHAKQYVNMRCVYGFGTRLNLTGPEVDIEAQAESISSGIIRDDAVFELQPMLSLSLYYGSSTDGVRTMAGQQSAGPDE